MRRNRKEEILIAAQELFRERGYAATSMADIGAKVGLLKGSLYSRFSSKEDILLQVMEKPMNEGDRESHSSERFRSPVA